MGNYSEYGSHVIVIDTIAPNIPIPNSNTPTNEINPTWSWEANEDVLEYEVVLNSVSQGTQIENSFTATNLSEGNNTLQVRAKDAIGNWSAYGTHVVTIDITAPNIPNPSTQTPTNNSSPTWTWNANSDVVEYEIELNGNAYPNQSSASFTANHLPNGSHEIKVKAIDSVGNKSVAGTHIVFVNTTPPSTPIPSASTPTNNSSITWTWSQDNSVELYEVTLNNVLIGTQTSNNYLANNLSEGQHEIKVRAKDNVGNYSEYGSHIVEIDLTSPNTPTPNSFTPTNNISPTWTWSEDDDVVEYEIIFDNISLGTQTDNSYTAYSLTEGSHTIKVRAKDSVGNLSAYGVHTIQIDTTPPDAPTPNTQTPTKDKTPTWSWSHADDVSSYEVTLNGVVIGSQTSNYFTSSTLNDGTHEIKVKAIDFAGNTSLYGSHIVTIDTTPPSIPVPTTLSPTNNRNPEWTWNQVQDAVLYEIILDGIAKGLQTGNNFIANNLSDGTHEINVRAKDAVGNFSEYGSSIVEIDATPPSIPRPSSVSPTANPNPTWSWLLL